MSSNISFGPNAKDIQILAGDLSPLDRITLGVWLPVGGSTAALFTTDCLSPAELWNVAHALNTNREETLALRFNYIRSNYSKPSAAPGLSIDDLTLDIKGELK